MTPERRNQALLIVLLAVLLIVAWIRLGPLPSLGNDDGGPLFGNRSVDTAPGNLDGQVLKLAEVGSELRSYEVKRDPFRFGEPPRPPAPAPTPPPVVVHRPPPPPPAPVNLGPQPPPLDLTFLGRFGPARRPIAVFTDGESIINAREGDVVGEHFLVLGIGFESVDLGYVDFPDLPAQRLGVGS